MYVLIGSYNIVLNVFKHIYVNTFMILVMIYGWYRELFNYLQLIFLKVFYETCNCIRYSKTDYIFLIY